MINLGLDLLWMSVTNNRVDTRFTIITSKQSYGPAGRSANNDIRVCNKVSPPDDAIATLLLSVPPELERNDTRAPAVDTHTKRFRRCVQLLSWSVYTTHTSQRRTRTHPPAIVS